MPPKTKHGGPKLRNEIRQVDSPENNDDEVLAVRDTNVGPDEDTMMVEAEEDEERRHEDVEAEAAGEGLGDALNEDVLESFRREDNLVCRTQGAGVVEGEQGNVQADTDMGIDEEEVAPADNNNDSSESTDDESEQGLLTEVYRNWGITTLRDTLKGKPKNTWLSRHTDLTDGEWDIETLRDFRNLSRLTKNKHTVAKETVAKRLSWRQHRDGWEGTGSERAVKEPRLRDDLKAICAELKGKNKRKADDDDDDDDEGDGEPKKRKVKKQKKKDSSSRDDDSDYLEPGTGEKGPKRKVSSRVPDDEDTDLLEPQQDEGDDSSPSPDTVPSVDPCKKNGENGKKANESPKEKAKATPTPKSKAKRKKNDDTDSTASEPPTANTIQSPEERDETLGYIYENWGIDSLLQYLPVGLRPVGVNNDTELDWEIIARMHDLSYATNTPAQRNNLRQALADEVRERTGSSTEQVLADIAIAGEQYHLAEQAGINNRRSLSAQRPGRQLQAETPTSDRTLRSQSRLQVPPATGQPAEAAQANNTIAGTVPEAIASTQAPGAAAATNRHPPTVNALPPPTAPPPASGPSPAARSQPKAPAATKKSKAPNSQTPGVVKPSNRNGNTTQQPTKRTQQQGGHDLFPPGPPSPPTYRPGQQLLSQARTQPANPLLPPAHLFIGNSDAASRRRELDDTRRRFREAQAVEENFDAEVRWTQARDENAVLRREAAHRETERLQEEVRLAEEVVRGDEGQDGPKRRVGPGAEAAGQQRGKR